MEKYRGDTFIFSFSFEDDSNFEAGDKLKFGMKKSYVRENYALFKEITIEEAVAEVQIEFEAEETKNLETGIHTIELELTRNGVVETCYRDELEVIGDVVR